MGKSKHSFNHLILGSMILIALLSIGLMGYLWVSYINDFFQKEISSLKKTHFAEQKARIQKDVIRTVSIIKWEQQQSQEKLKEQLKDNVNVAWHLAHKIYQTSSTKLPPQKVKLLIKNTLSALRFNNGRGYIFATSLDGTPELHPIKPDLEGSKQIFDDHQKTLVLQKKLKTITTSKLGEGFITYDSIKPGLPGDTHRKLSFLKRFEPLGWYIGCGEYTKDFTDQVKKQVLKHLKSKTTKANTYIFAGRYDGLSLLGPATGKNMLQIKDSSGMFIVQELIKTARNGGGFVKYIAPKYKNRPPQLKLSYVSPIPEWQWYVGTGIPIEDIESIIKQKRREISASIRKDILTIIATITGLLIFIVILAKMVSHRIERTLQQFTHFFHQAAERSTQINLSDLPFIEFTGMALSANQMILAREKAQQTLSEKESSLRITLNAITDGVISTNAAGLILQMNPVAEQLTGFIYEDVRNMHYSQIMKLLSPEDQSPINLETILSQKEEELSMHLILQNLQEEKNHIMLSYTRKMSRSGKLLGWVFVLRDISESIHFEERLRQSQKMESVGKLAGGIAHNFNNYLTAILGFSDILKNDLQAEPDKLKFAEKIYSTTQKAGDLTKKLLMFSRRSKTKLVSTNIHCTLLESLALLSPNLDNNITVQKNLNADDLTISGDPTQLQTLFLNLFMNASEAINTSGKITLTTTNISVKSRNKPDSIIQISDGDYVKIDVSDTGSGISAEIAESIFDPFFSTKTKVKNSGLGLTTVYGIIKDHHGGIHFKSDSLRGTTFSIYLPIQKEGNSTP